MHGQIPSFGRERYDRDVADVFAIESELAGKIVAQLQAETLS